MPTIATPAITVITSRQVLKLPSATSSAVEPAGGWEARNRTITAAVSTIAITEVQTRITVRSRVASTLGAPHTTWRRPPDFLLLLAKWNACVNLKAAFGRVSD